MPAGDLTFMRRKVEAVMRELRAGQGPDAWHYRSLLDIRARANDRTAVPVGAASLSGAQSTQQFN
jgi:hypothetical protein